MSEPSNAAQATPPEAEKSQPPEQLPHDGIIEHDNFLPRWWLATLFGAIVFSFGYWFYFHTTGAGMTQLQELEADEKVLGDLRLKAMAAKVSDDMLVGISKDPAAVERGKAIFTSTCVACHGAKAEGGIGPNLTDGYWIHGGKPAQVYRTVAFGVPDKGMLSWGPTLGATKVQEVVGYVLTLKNTNVAGKAPQGDKEP
jgi:cytochrome c oxidase cbb3-type subunit 3